MFVFWPSCVKDKHELTPQTTIFMLASFNLAVFVPFGWIQNIFFFGVAILAIGVVNWVRF